MELCPLPALPSRLCHPDLLLAQSLCPTSGFRCSSASDPSSGVMNPHTGLFLRSTSARSKAQLPLAARCCPRASPLPPSIAQPWAARAGSGPILTLDVPGPPDSIVETDFIPAQQSQPLEILPLGRHQLPAETPSRGQAEGRCLHPARAQNKPAAALPPSHPPQGRAERRPSGWKENRFTARAELDPMPVWSTQSYTGPRDCGVATLNGKAVQGGAGW